MKRKWRVSSLGAARKTKIKQGGQLNARSPRQRGELAEVAFACKATVLALTLRSLMATAGVMTSSWDPHGRLLRVQVKSTDRFKKGGYLVGACRFSPDGTKQAYMPKQIDFLAVHIVPRDMWYVIPVLEFAPRKWLSFYPQNLGSKGRYERFREAWYLTHWMEEVMQKEGFVDRGRR